VCDIVVKIIMFAISSLDEFLWSCRKPYILQTVQDRR